MRAWCAALWADAIRAMRLGVRRRAFIDSIVPFFCIRLVILVSGLDQPAFHLSRVIQVGAH